jgi:LytS/YehU family sensor histidine kinase
MVLSLADFLRTALTMDPARQITLGEEIALQALYLDIERARFPHRLQVAIDVPDRLRDALVPNLITQPLIENAIKYGVARSLLPVRLEVVARDEGGRLSIEVRDDGAEVGPSPNAPSTQLGLLNISERLRLQFGSEARLVAGRQPAGGFAACIELPLTMRG